MLLAALNSKVGDIMVQPSEFFEGARCQSMGLSLVVCLEDDVDNGLCVSCWEPLEGCNRR